MATNYPGGYDSFTRPNPSDKLSNPRHTVVHDDIADAIEAIEAELGANPSDSYTTVAERLSIAADKNVSLQLNDGTAMTVGDGKAYFRIPPTLNGFDIIGGSLALVGGASSSGTPTMQIARGRQASPTSAHSYVDIFSTPITVDVNEYDSKDATTPAIVNTSNDDLLTGDILRIDVDAIGTGLTSAVRWIVTITMQKP